MESAQSSGAGDLSSAQVAGIVIGVLASLLAIVIGILIWCYIAPNCSQKKLPQEQESEVALQEASTPPLVIDKLDVTDEFHL